MYFKGFKLSVSLNFIFMLLLGMMLTNFIVGFFWQQHVIDLSIDYARSNMSLLSKRGDYFCDEVVQDDMVYDTVTAAIHIRPEMSFAILQGGSVVYKGGERVSGLADVLLKASNSESELTRSEGSFISPFGLLSEKIMVAAPFPLCDSIQAGAIVIYVPDILRVVYKKHSIIAVYLLVNIIILSTLWFFRTRRLVIEPLEKLVDIADSYEIREDDYIGPVSRKNEFGQLADALRNMIARIDADKEKLKDTIHSLEEANKQILENQATLVEAEKFAAIGRLAAGLAHEIGNPLGIIQGYLELLERDDINEKDRRQYFDRAGKELDRLTGLIRQLLEMARKERDEKAIAHVPSVMHELVDILQHQKNSKSIQFDIFSDEHAENVRCSEAELNQVLLNCLLNSIDAINELGDPHGRIDLRCRSDENEAEMALIEICDTGGGVDDAELSSLFDPFYTTKHVGQGTGLGLSVSRSIVESCGGTIMVKNLDTGGTCVIITLQVANDQG